MKVNEGGMDMGEKEGVVRIILEKNKQTNDEESSKKNIF